VRPDSHPTIEEILGTRWTVWVGGIAPALGALFLVRYSIESGFFGSGIRTIRSLVLALCLIGAGEFLRRKENGHKTATSLGWSRRALISLGF